MVSSAPTVFALLDAEWAALATTVVPTHWHHQSALRLAEILQPTLGDLLAFTERRDDPARSDQVLAALVWLAGGTSGTSGPGGHDPLAARTVLQMLLPGAKALARRLSWLGDAQERAAAVTATLYEQIRRYPIERRPARIAANLLADTHQRLLRRAGGAGRKPGETTAAGPILVPVSLEALAAHGEGSLPEAPPVAATPAEELLALLAWAVRNGYLTPAQGRLIGQTRIGDTPCEELGARAGLGAHSLRRRRQRAEQALGRAAITHALGPNDLSRLLPLPSRCA